MNFSEIKSNETELKNIFFNQKELSILDKIEVKLSRIFGQIISFFKYEFTQGVSNFWRYRKVIWNHRWYDYSFADDVIHELYKDRADNWYKSHYVNSEHDERELKIIVELFVRLKEAEYLCSENDEEDKIRKEIYNRIARKRYWD